MAEETHDKQFTGWWIPAYAVEWFETGELSAKELILIATIDSLSKRQEGCFASNAYLGAKVHVGETQVRSMLSHLRQLGLITYASFNGRTRRILVHWSTPPQPAPVESESAELTPDGQLGTSVAVRGSLSRRSEGPKSDPRLNKGLDKNTNLPTNVGRRELAPGVSASPTPANTSAPRLENDLLGFERFAQNAAEHLLETLRLNKSDLVFAVPPKRDLTAKGIVKHCIMPLLTSGKATKQEIRELLVWYREAYGGTYIPSLYKIEDMYVRWERFRAAKARWDEERQKSDGNDNQRGGETEEQAQKVEQRRTLVEKEIAGWTKPKRQAHCDALNRLCKLHGQVAGRYADISKQEQVDEVLEELGLDAGTFDLYQFVADPKIPDDALARIRQCKQTAASRPEEMVETYDGS